VVVYIQKASFTPLGNLIETEEQRKIAKLVSEGAHISDSPPSQLDLHHKLFEYLKKNAVIVGTKDLMAQHSICVSFETSNSGLVSMDITLGWSNITCNSQAIPYLVHVFEEMGYSVNTKQSAYGG
jgi:hypothetical protein